MGIDQEAIRKRFSQLETDINNMNKMIDDNLQISEKGPVATEEVEQEAVAEGSLSPKQFAEVTAEAASQFINSAAAQTGDTVVVSVETEVKTVEADLQNEPVETADSGVPTELAAPQEPVHIDQNANTTDHVIDQTTDTSEDFTAGNVTTAISSDSSPSRSVTPIVLPKKGAEAAAPTAAQTKTTLRRPTNPFRVVSVGTPHTDAAGSRKSSNEPRVADPDSVTKLQKRLDYLTKKCLKLQKEINYLNDMNYKNTLSIEDKRKLASAIDKLQEYLDRKTKEKYDLGVLVSRQLRKEIDRGENGQFWIGTK